MRMQSILPLTPEQEAHFWERVDVVPGICWEWQGGTTPLNYGRVCINYQYLYAHRVAYTLLIGPIDDGIVLDHLCRNPRCVNPDHLEAVTHKVNVHRGAGPAARNAKKTVCKHGHPLTGYNLKIGYKGTRMCRICFNEQQRKRYHKKRKKRNVIP